MRFVITSTGPGETRVPLSQKTLSLTNSHKFGKLFVLSKDGLRKRAATTPYERLFPFSRNVHNQLIIKVVSSFVDCWHLLTKDCMVS